MRTHAAAAAAQLRALSQGIYAPSEEDGGGRAPSAAPSAAPPQPSAGGACSAGGGGDGAKLQRRGSFSQLLGLGRAGGSSSE
eukprot:6733729-Prymnesium_polylepis.1